MDGKEESSSLAISTEQVLHKILSKLSNLEVGLSILSTENYNRIEEIVKIGKKLGLPFIVETDHEESETSPQEKNRIKRERTPSITEDEEENLKQNRSNPPRNTNPAKDIIRIIKVLTR